MSDPLIKYEKKTSKLASSCNNQFASPNRS